MAKNRMKNWSQCNQRYKFWRRPSETPFCKRKVFPVLHSIKTKAISEGERPCKDVCWNYLACFWNILKFPWVFIIPKMIGHSHSAIWAQRRMKQVSNSFVLRYFSKKWVLGTSSGVLTEFYAFFAQDNQKGLFFHIQLEAMMSEVCKAQTNGLKTLLYVLIGPIRILGPYSWSKNIP